MGACTINHQHQVGEAAVGVCTINHQHQVVEAVGLVVVVHIDLEEFRNMPISFAFEVAHAPQIIW